ncbi:MAG: TetR/AcrR family transcriptional regulator [Polyangiales bacterium]
MPPREERRHQILERARDVFARKGYHQATIDDIVAACGVARGTFYLYFHDKRSIFEELLSAFFQKIAMSVVRIHTDRPLEPQVVENVSRVVDLFLNDPHMAKILLADAVGVDPDFDRRLLAFYSDVTGLLEESLKEGQSVGIVRAGDARVATHFVIGGLKEVLLQFARAKVPVDRVAVVREVYLLLRQGVLLERAPTKKAAAKPKKRAARK